MIVAFSTRLEACDPARNRWRLYRVEAGRDLFGTWVVAVTLGRIGAARRRAESLPGGGCENRQGPTLQHRGEGIS